MKLYNCSYDKEGSIALSPHPENMFVAVACANKVRWGEQMFPFMFVCVFSYLSPWQPWTIQAWHCQPWAFSQCINAMFEARAVYLCCNRNVQNIFDKMKPWVDPGSWATDSWPRGQNVLLQKRTVKPRGLTVHPEKVDSWAPGFDCPGPNLPMERKIRA